MKIGKSILSDKRPQINNVKKKHLDLYVETVLAVLRRQNDNSNGEGLYIEQIRKQSGIKFWGTAQQILESLHKYKVVDRNKEAGRVYYKLRE